MKYLKTFEKMDIDKKDDNSDLIPSEIVDTFIKRINNLIKDGCDKNSPSIKQELDRIKRINGKTIPTRIKTLLGL